MRETPGKSTRISVILVVLNEESRIETCLRSLAWADEIIVVDGGSQDRTRELAGRFTNEVYLRPFDDFATQKNYAIGLSTGDWILAVDADEMVTSELRKDLLGVAHSAQRLNGFRLRRINHLFGKKLRFAGQNEEMILRFFRRGTGRFVQSVHEKLAVIGRVGTLRGSLLHHSTPTVGNYLKKLVLYTGLEAEELRREGKKSPQSLNVALVSLARFLWFYFFRLGFLDGFEGFLYHALSSFHFLLKYARLQEIEKGGVLQRAQPNLSEATL